MNEWDLWCTGCTEKMRGVKMTQDRKEMRRTEIEVQSKYQITDYILNFVHFCGLAALSRPIRSS